MARTVTSLTITMPISLRDKIHEILREHNLGDDQRNALVIVLLTQAIESYQQGTMQLPIKQTAIIALGEAS